MPVSIEEAVRAYLVNDADVAPLVGGTAASGSNTGQVYKARIPQTATLNLSLGFIWYEVLSDVADTTLDGQPTGSYQARVMLTLEAANESQLKSLIEAVRGRKSKLKLDGLTTQELGFGPNVLWCQYCRVEDRPDDYEPNRHSGDVGTFLSHLGLVIHYYSP